MNGLSAIPPSLRPPGAKFSSKACVNHESQCVKTSPAPRSSSLVKVRTLTEKKTRVVIGWWELRLSVAPDALFNFEVAEHDGWLVVEGIFLWLRDLERLPHLGGSGFLIIYPIKKKSESKTDEPQNLNSQFISSSRFLSNVGLFDEGFITYSRLLVG